jgi:pyruvate/2-oxoglutarate dehydrogenase complex dihydrolipoamide acyltransferase (E2) component
MSIPAQVPILPKDTRHASLEAIYVCQSQWVARDEILFDIETEKVVLEIAAEQSGIIDEIFVSKGDAVEAEQVILTLRAPTEQELDDILFEIETDKVVLEIPAPPSGAPTKAKPSELTPNEQAPDERIRP